jgi:hypothetical protein
MADISHLGGLQSVEQLDLENYVDNRKSTFQLPKKGRYTLRAPDAFPSTAFTRTKKTGALSVQIDPTIVGPTNEGFQLRYTNVSATPFKRGGSTVSQLGDYLRACGSRAILKTEKDQADAAEATAGTMYQADIDWRVYNKTTGFALEGMEKFPKLEDGSYQSWIEDTGDIDAETGKPKRLRANLVISRFVAPESN